MEPFLGWSAHFSYACRVPTLTVATIRKRVRVTTCLVPEVYVSSDFCAGCRWGTCSVMNQISRTARLPLLCHCVFCEVHFLRGAYIANYTRFVNAERCLHDAGQRSLGWSTHFFVHSTKAYPWHSHTQAGYIIYCESFQEFVVNWLLCSSSHSYLREPATLI